MNKKEIYNNIYDDFYKNYHLIISNELKKMEQYRKFLQPTIAQMLTGAFLSFCVFIVVGLTYKFIPYKQIHCFIPFLLLVCVLVTLFLSMIINQRVYNFSKTLKKEIMPAILYSLNSVMYIPDGLPQNINELTLKKHGFKTLYLSDNKKNEEDLKFSKDYFCGSRNGVKFECVEHFGNYVYVSFELNKVIEKQIVVASKEVVIPSFFRFDLCMDNGALLLIIAMIGVVLLVVSFIGFGFYGVLFFCINLFVAYLLFIGAQQGVFKSLKSVVLEDVNFNKQFMVFSNDEVEARYLVTPSFMERLKSMQLAFCAKNIKCSVLDDRILFVIKTKKNLFELGNVFSQIDNSTLVKEVFNQIASIMLMIDHFKLDEKTGL